VLQTYEERFIIIGNAIDQR